jgi:GH24 family phage-related lysozyme (muramidase)
MKNFTNILTKTNDFLKTRPVYNSLNPNQIAGLLDTAYNIGTGWTKAKNGKLLDVTADIKKIDQIPDVLMMYKNAGGKPVQGLINRRQRAVDLFNTEYTPPAPPENDKNKTSAVDTQ